MTMRLNPESKGEKPKLDRTKVIPCPYGTVSNDTELCDGVHHFWKHKFSDSHEYYRECPLQMQVSAWEKRLHVRGGVKFDTYDSKHDPYALKSVKKWVEDPSSILLMGSEPGHGKTKLALGAYEALRRALKYRVEFIPSVDFAEMAVESSRPKSFDAIESGALSPMEKLLGESPRAVSMRNLAEYLSLPPLVVILDDLGAERVTDTTIDYLRRVLEVAEGVLITTNFGGEDIERIYGSRIVSRLELADKVGLKDGDYRKIEKKGRQLA